jgi:DNA-binding LacI/PurR family transcriptional regulator
MSVTMKDIAERTGVSVSTVSLALAGHPRISEETRVRIARLARELGYRPPGERRQVEQCISVVLADSAHRTGGPVDYLYHEAIGGVLDEVMVAGAVLQIVRLAAKAEHGAEELIERLQVGRAQGAVVVGSVIDPVIFRSFDKAGFPCIYVGKRELQGTQTSWVASNYIEGAQLAVQRLIDLGHRHIGLLGSVPDHEPWMRERAVGYRLALSEAGLQGIHLTPSGAPGAASLDPAAWVRDGVTAVFTLHLPLAAQLLGLCATGGIRVPGDLSVITFDDGPLAEHVNPPITAVRQPMRKLGSTAASTLLSWLRGVPRTPVQIRLQPEMVVRASCGPPGHREPAPPA